MCRKICWWKHFLPTQCEQKKSGNGTGVFQHRRAFSQFKRKRWFLVRDLYQRSSCINTISASLRPSPAAPHPTVGAHSDTNTLEMQRELCCSPHSLHLHQLHSNLSRGEHSEVYAEHQVSGARRHETSHHILFGISGSNHVPQKQL